MSSYNNKNNTLTKFGSNIRVLNTPMEQYVTEGELVEGLATKQDILQYDVLPSASADNLGKIVQYVGTTNADYQNGEWYECVSNGELPPTYSWELTSVTQAEFENTKEEIQDELENRLEKSVFYDNFKNVPSNILQLTDGKYTSDNFTIVIKDNIITVDGSFNNTTDGLFLKLSNGIDVQQLENSASIPSSWKTQSLNNMFVLGKKYAFTANCLNGGCNADAEMPNVIIRASDNTLVASNDTIFQYNGDGAFMYCFLGRGKSGNLNAFNNFSFVITCVETEDELPLQYSNTDTAIYNILFKKYVAERVGGVTFATLLASDLSVNNIAGQGLCTDGTYIYMTVIDSNPYANAWVYKYDFNGNIINSANLPQLHHANDITYCIWDNKLYIPDLDTPNIIHKVNVSDLSYDSSITIDLSNEYPGYTGISHIAYDEKRDVFICLVRGSHKGIALFDRDFTLIDFMWISFPNDSDNIVAGLCTFNDVIYIHTSINMIYSYSFSGKLLGVCNRGKKAFYNEGEGIFIKNDKIYTVENRSGWLEVNINRYNISRWATALAVKV